VMNMLDVIRNKRDGRELTHQEISFFVNGFVSGQIPDYQAAAFLMAVFLNGMTERETFELTLEMVESGSVIDWKGIGGAFVDKHSTGGVGDKTTLVVLPLVAAFGVHVGKLSGRGLGHTGGTIDKLESIPGFNTHLTVEEMKRQVADIGVVIAGQSEDVAVADKKIYALRDVTATVESIPLIVSSIMSKKVAGGADGFVFDVKVGRGALMKDEESSLRLANLLLDVSRRFGKGAVAVLTRMEQPLGFSVGNSLEVIEAIDTMKGSGSSDFMRVCEELAFHMIKLAGKDVERDEIARAMVDGRALAKFKELVGYQGGDVRVVDDYSLLPVGRKVSMVKADRDGYISSVDALAIGLMVMAIGGGRRFKEDVIDHSVGVKLLKKVGDLVRRGDVCMEIYYNDEDRFREAVADFGEFFTISDSPVKVDDVIVKVVK